MIWYEFLVFLSISCAFGSNPEHLRVKRATQCGVSSLASGLIFNGQTFERGSWPWMVAVMSLKTSPPRFFCAGVLVSASKVLTAAHCIHKKSETKPKNARDILLKFGAYDLSDPYENGIVQFVPSSISVHPDWNPFVRSFDADIALLELDLNVPYTNFIRPICLSTTELHENVGFVAGWGRSENSKKGHENIPRQIRTPILSNEECVFESPEFSFLTSKRTVCAGDRNGQGPCSGDSGGGLFVKLRGVFYLKGLVSASLINEGRCDVTAFSVFTNVNKFINWIGISTNDPEISEPEPIPNILPEQVVRQSYGEATERPHRTDRIFNALKDFVGYGDIRPFT